MHTTSANKANKLIGAMVATQVLLSACATQQPTVITATPGPTATERVVVVTATPIPPTPTERVIVVTATPDAAQPTAEPQPTATARVIVVTASPRPTARPTRTPAPTAPPNDLAIDLDNAPGGANNDDLDVTITASRFNQNGTNFIGFRVLARLKGSAKDGDGIDSVQFTITDQDNGNTVYFHTERAAPYCAFQESSGTNCRVLTARQGEQWRTSDSGSGVPQVPFRDGTFKLQVTVQGKNSESWFAESTFKIKTIGGQVKGCTTGRTAITSPADGSTIRGVVRVRGTATCDNLWYYKFEFEDPRCEGGLCFVAGPSQPVTPGQPFTRDVVNGVLMNWDTRRIPNGTYTLRLVALGQGNVLLPQISRVVVTIAN